MPELFFPPEFNWKNPDYTPVYAERIKRINALRQDKNLVPAVKAFYKDNPVHFIHDFGMTFDPRLAEIGKQTTFPFLLFPKQIEFIQWLNARWRSREDGLCEKSRDMGVSWLCAGFGVWMFLFYEGTVVGFGSRKEEYVDSIGDPKSLFVKIRQFLLLLPPEFQPAKWDVKKHAPHMKIINPENESTIIGEAGDNIGRGARTSIYFKDESAHYDHAESIDAALSQTSNCKIDLSSVNGEGNQFHRKRHSGKIPVFVFDWHDDPRKDQAWYEREKQKIDNPKTVAQEIDRDYSASITDSFIPGDEVTVAMSKGPADIQPMGRLRVGVDVARFGDDKSAIAIRRGRVCLKIETREKKDTVQVASWVREVLSAFREMPEQIAVDTIGVGAGVADILRGWFPDRVMSNRTIKTVMDVNFSLRMDNGHDYNLRAFCYRELREWIKGCSLPNDQELRTDLTALRYDFKSGELIIESKDDAKKRGVKSPDRADALAVTFAYPTIAQPERGPFVPAYEPMDSSMGALGG